MDKFTDTCKKRLEAKGKLVNGSTMYAALKELYKIAQDKGIYEKKHAKRFDELRTYIEEIEFQVAVDEQALIQGYNLQGFWDTDGVPE